MTRRVQSELQYRNCSMIYHFVGARIPSKTNPHRRQVFIVRMESDGTWYLNVQGKPVQSGIGRMPNRDNARKIIEAWRASHVKR